MPQAVTDTYDALYTTTMRKARPVLEDLVSSSCKAFYFAKRSGSYHVVDALGTQIQQPLMTALGTPTVYSGFGTIDVTPRQGMDTAFFNWRQFGDSVTISGEEERKNTGELAIIDLLAAKTKQTMLGMIELWDRAFLQGNGPNVATQITTAYTDPTSGAVLFDPLPLLVSKSGTGTVGGINASTTTSWKNQYVAAGATTYEGHLQEMRNMFNLCGQGPGGDVDWLLADQSTFELTERALAKYHTNYNKADIPFDNFTFKGANVVWDPYVADVDNATIAGIPVSTSCSVYFINNQFLHIYVDKQTNFEARPFQVPYNQDAKSTLILWRGATAVSNRRKLGVLGSIANTIVS